MFETGCLRRWAGVRWTGSEIVVGVNSTSCGVAVDVAPRHETSGGPGGAAAAR